MESDAIVYVVDDDDAARDSLAFLMKSATIPVKTFENAAAFLAIAANISVGCVITDVRMPEISGIEMLRRLRELKSAIPVIVITGHGDISLAVEAMKAGASDFFEKPFEDDALLAAVQSCLRSNENEAKRHAIRVTTTERLATLSARERQVLEGLVAGKANKIIAFDYGISPRTVEIYRANVMTKMQASTLSDLIRMTMIAGVLDEANSVVPSARR